MVRADGLNALSLRALARAVDMEPQSLYTYFSSKHAVYDQLFADGNHELLARLEQMEISDDPREMLRAMARLFVTFVGEDQARYELLFLRTIPDFEPSADSYAVAVAVFSKGRSALAAVGLRNDSDFDLWTALVAGLASQQLANDPGGDRYLRLIDDAIAMFAEHVFAPGVDKRSAKP
jgi:AcrR family transcriptional regulator